MRGVWSATAASPNKFCLPHEVFKLGLGHGPLLVYLYLVYRKGTGYGTGKMNYAVIGKAVGMCEKTVRTHLHTLADTGFIKMEYHGQRFSYALCPIQSKVCKRSNSTPCNRWISTKRTWLTGEVFDAVFPVPNEVFQLGLQPGELLVYIYLHYQRGVRSGQCWPSYATIGAAVGMSRKTVQKHIGSLINKGLIQAEETMIRRKDGRRCNGSLLYTIRPMEQVLREREKESLAQLKQAEAQQKWDRHCQQRGCPRFAL